jgi:hypothetical protein
MLDGYLWCWFLATFYLVSIGIVSSNADIPIGGLRFALLEKIAKCTSVNGVESE